MSVVAAFFPLFLVVARALGPVWSKFVAHQNTGGVKKEMGEEEELGRDSQRLSMVARGNRGLLHRHILEASEHELSSHSF